MKKLYQLDPGIPILELMAVREVNKMEEFYYTPTLSAQAGGDILYDSWYEPVKPILCKGWKTNCAKWVIGFTRLPGKSAKSCII